MVFRCWWWQPCESHGGDFGNSTKSHRERTARLETAYGHCNASDQSKMEEASHADNLPPRLFWYAFCEYLGFTGMVSQLKSGQLHRLGCQWLQVSEADSHELQSRPMIISRPVSSAGLIIGCSFWGIDLEGCPYIWAG
jgi:hypothetical protein